MDGGAAAAGLGVGTGEGLGLGVGCEGRGSRWAGGAASQRPARRGLVRLFRLTEHQNRNNRSKFGSSEPRTEPGTEYFGFGYFGFGSYYFGSVLGYFCPD